MITKDAVVSGFLAKDQGNSKICAGVPEKYLKAVFDSTGFRKLFATYFDEEIYNCAKLSFEKNNYFPMRECYAILGITKVIEDVMISCGYSKPSIIQSMNQFLSRNYYTVNKSERSDAEIVSRLTNYITGRFDIRLFEVENPNLEVLSVSDKKASIAKPGWLQKNGVGYMVQSYNGVLELSFHSSTGGKLEICLRGKDVRDKEGNRIPYWIDYTYIQYNDFIVLEDVKPAWHDRPIRLEYPLKAGETIQFYVEWVPHRSDEISEKEIKTEIKQEEIKDIGFSREKKETEKNEKTGKVIHLFHKFTGKK